MATSKKRTEHLFSLIREGASLSTKEQIDLVWRLSLPAIFAQISFVIVQYIDAAMVGHLGPNPAAAVGLVSTSLWLIWGLVTSITAGFTVQVAQRIGAKEFDEARSVLRQSFLIGGLISLLIGAIGVAIAGWLPGWLGGGPELAKDATSYFFIFCAGAPILFFEFLASGMLRSTGNIKLPSLVNIGMCFLDALFNLLLIYPTSDYEVLGFEFTLPGAGLGVTGAALGTILVEVVCAAILLWCLLVRSDKLSLVGHPGSFIPDIFCLRRAFRIGSPLALERFAMSTAQIVTTMIVAPLGNFALAAHSFAITAESLCYMPGFGVADAAATLVGQSIGAKRPELAKRLARINIIVVMVLMTAMGFVMYIVAPWMIGFMTDNQEIIRLGSSALRIEAFAEPMFAAAIVSYSIFVGAGYTLVPSLINLISMWTVRLPLAYLLASSYGLNGVWFAMATELCVRGCIFLWKVSHFDFSKRRGID